MEGSVQQDVSALWDRFCKDNKVRDNIRIFITREFWYLIELVHSGGFFPFYMSGIL